MSALSGSASSPVGFAGGFGGVGTTGKTRALPVSRIEPGLRKVSVEEHLPHPPMGALSRGIWPGTRLEGSRVLYFHRQRISNGLSGKTVLVLKCDDIVAGDSDLNDSPSGTERSVS